MRSTTEQQQRLVDWNDTAIDLPAEETIPELVERQVERTPHAPAVVCNGVTLSYEELDGRANALARELVRHGAGPEILVGLCASPSIELVVGLLGILKAGAAYVPLDPALPERRLAFLLEDSRASHVLVQRGLEDRLPRSSAQVLRLDGTRREPGLPPRTTGDGLAYVLYTSGSTGRPKGVCMPHRPLVNLVCWHGNKLSAGARTLQLASLGFDVSFHEVFSALASGGVVLPAPEALRRDVPALLRFIERNAVEKVTLPVTVLREVAAECAQRPAPQRSVPLGSLRDVIATGEALLADAALERLFAGLPRCRLHNHYGPSETHLVTVYPMPSAPWPARPPIGRPIDNARCYVLDAELQPVPIGERGELYLGGIALARNYLRRAALTAERFVPDPFSAEAGARMYRSGDIVRWRSEEASGAELEFLGRVDHQVKLGGVRVEPGEVEAALVQHPGVRAATVVVQRGERLVAYVVPTDDVAEAELRAHLRERLPAQLVPARIVTLDELPLTAHGKIDRDALPEPTPAPRGFRGSPIRGAREEAIAETWRRVLEIESLGAEDNFFDLGGTSLSLIRMRRLLQEALGEPVATTDLFEHPTVRSFAAHTMGRGDETDRDNETRRARREERQRERLTARHGRGDARE